MDRDRRDDVEVVRGRGVRAEEPERKNEEHPSDAEASQQRAGEDALDEERDERRARVDRRVELAEQVLAPGSRTSRGLVEADQIQEVPELHEEVPEEDADAERPEHPVRCDGAVPLDRVLDARAETLRTLLLETASVPLGKAAIDQEADEAHEEA